MALSGSGCAVDRADRVKEASESLVRALIRGEERGACDRLTERADRSLGEEASAFGPAGSPEPSCSTFVKTVSDELSRRDRSEISQVLRAEAIEVDGSSAEGVLDFGDEERTFEAVLDDGTWLIDEFEPAGLLADRIEAAQARAEQQAEDPQDQDPGNPARVVGQLELSPAGRRADSSNARGVAVITEQRGNRQLVVQAMVSPNEAEEAYEVWLYNSESDAVSLGAQIADDAGAFQGAGPLPENFERYDFIDVSRESIRGDTGHSGDSVLRARLDALAPPP